MYSRILLDWYLPLSLCIVQLSFIHFQSLLVLTLLTYWKSFCLGSKGNHTSTIPSTVLLGNSFMFHVFLSVFRTFLTHVFKWFFLSSGVKASTWTYSVAIKACRAPPGVRLSQLDFAKGLELLDEMRKNNLEPDSMTYTAVFVLCAQAKQGSTANTIYQVVLRRFLSWTLITSCQNDVIAPTSTVTQSSVWFELQEV